MAKRLSGSAGTGKKIMQNLDLFDFDIQSPENVTDKDFYAFTWTFGNQSGTAVINLTDDGFINQSSTLNCHNFQRPLGAYNDNTLYDVFGMMLEDKNIIHK